MQPCDELKNMALGHDGKLINGHELPVRHTRIYHKEDGVWKMVHLHVSIAVPNESIEA